MKILFICDAALRDGVLEFASWIAGIIGILPPDTELTVACEGCDDGEYAAQGRRLGVLRFDTGASPEELARKIGALKPDAAVIFGTEKVHTLYALSACELAGTGERTALFAQGLACACARHYCDGVPAAVVRRYTLRDILRRSNIRAEQRALERRADAEREAIRRAGHIIGRTSLDRAVSQRINPAAVYHRCGDLMRPCFYEGEWRCEDCEPQRIFVSQYYYPIKGFHYLLEAASELAGKYPRLRIAAAGYNPVETSLDRRELKDSSYIRYIKKLAARYGLTDRIELLGELSAEEMKREYLRANVFALPSTIENSPNSLGEAMLLGVPCAASFVGGVADLAENGSEALLYPSNDTELLAHCIDSVFKSPEAAARLGKNARLRALKEYDPAKNGEAFVKALTELAGK